MLMYAIGAIIIFVMILIVLSYRSVEDSLMKGFWRADSQFCEDAELTMFVLYLSDNVNYFGNTRNGYLVASNDQGIILNNPIKLNFSWTTNVLPGLSHCKNYDVSIDWLETPPDDPEAFPSELSAAYYPKYGKLILYKNDEVLASLWRDNQMSAMDCSEQLVPDGIKEEATDGVNI